MVGNTHISPVGNIFRAYRLSFHKGTSMPEYRVALIFQEESLPNLEKLNGGSRFMEYCDRLFWGYFEKAISGFKSAIALQ
jgi:hypothetical protein